MVALVDCNAFYCSCERAFNPALAHRPVVVLSNNDGCVIARTAEAKALDIPMGVPMHTLAPLIEKHNIAVFSSNYALYGDMSARVMTVLGQFAPDIEVYSIDEAFLDLKGFEAFNLVEYGSHIVTYTKQATGIPVSIGISKTKTLAKLANKLAKKNKDSKGVCVLATDEDIHSALRAFPIADVWGIGSKHAQRLHDMGVKTAFDFIQLPPHWVHKHMSIVGLRLWEELRGKPCYDLELSSPAKKNICTSRSFGKMLDNLSDIEEAIANHAASCGEKLRRQHSCASLITVFVATNPFRKDTPQYTNSISLMLPHPVNNAPELIHYAKHGLNIVFKKGYLYKKVGVIVQELTPESTLQTSLFRDTEQDEKKQKLMQTLDKLNRQFGKNTVKMAAQGTAEQRWKLRQEKCSPHYTTQFKDIFLVKAG